MVGWGLWEEAGFVFQAADTLGCVLVGQEVDSIKSMVYNSTKAYSLDVYPLLAKLIKENKEVYLKIS